MLAKSKKFLALFLTLCMVVGTMSTAAIAVEGEETINPALTPEGVQARME